MTRIYEDYPELFDASDTSQEWHDSCIDYAYGLADVRLEVYEREDILKLAKLLGEDLDANSPTPILRDSAYDLLDSVEVRRAKAVAEGEDHPKPTFHSDDDYEEFLKRTKWSDDPDFSYVIEDTGYPKRYEAIYNQARRVAGWARQGGYKPNDIFYNSDNHSIIGAWNQVNTDEFIEHDTSKWIWPYGNEFVENLDRLPDDLFDLIVTVLVVDNERAAVRLEAERPDPETMAKEYSWSEEDSLDWIAHDISSESGFQTQDCLDKMQVVGLSKHFTEAWAERLASSISVYCRIGAAHGSYPSILAKLSEDGRREVRVAVAGNPSTPVNVLERFIHDDNPKVRAALANHCDMRLDCFRPLASDDDDRVLRQILLNPSTPDDLFASIVDKCVERQSVYVFADNPHVSSDVFRKIDFDKINLLDQLFVTLAGNPSVPSDILERIFNYASTYFHECKEDAKKDHPIDEIHSVTWGYKISKEYLEDIINNIIYNPSAFAELLKKIKDVCSSNKDIYYDDLLDRIINSFTDED